MTKQEQELLQEIHRALKGDGLSKEIGIVGKIERMELQLETLETHMGKRIETLEDELKRLRNIVKGVAIGLLIAGIVFGVNSWESVAKLLKSL